ncbi:MAG: glycoside hydrolase family 25 protein [Acidobacteria bacterium]|nr:glycoside hydrolase family 25 protein [Acidobacteriota bacterium]
MDWDRLSTDSRVVAIIHQATKGSHRDTEYARRKGEAKRRGYKWGSYHLGLPGDPVAQADFYLSTAKPEEDEVMALDIEGLNPRKDMSLGDARRFILRVKEKTGRYPLLYANDDVAREVSRSYGRDEVFSKTLLWYARFRKNIPDFPKGTWDTYKLWQFSSEINCDEDNQSACLYRAPGTAHDMDVDVYNGSIDKLRRDWPFSGAALGGGGDTASGVSTRAEAYFVFNDGKDDFVFKLTDQARIQEARDILSGKEKSKKHVMGLIVPRREDYNRAWHYHLDPTSVSFFQNAVEVCDSTVRFVEDHLAEVGGSFLPGNRWCPWSSKLVREIPRPQGTGRRSVRRRHP